nr:MAG TPA: hypothetical protein [Crassvirales sp.]DAW87509.1 MAG TPA: hypothetical protein [Bacteriophage sp.]
MDLGKLYQNAGKILVTPSINQQKGYLRFI